MKHTPGPWEVIRYENEKLEVQGGPQGKLIAVVWPMDEGKRYPNPNASLIASAPDLLKACKEMVKFYDAKVIMPPDKFPGMWERVRLAISKAKGELI